MRRVLYILGLLADNDIEWMVGNGEKESLAPGYRMVIEGVAVDALFILVEGKLRVHLERSGRQLNILEPGEIVGEISLLDSRPPLASVTAVEESVVLRIPRMRLNRKLEADHAFAARFYKALGVFLAQRLRHTTMTMGFGGDNELSEEDADEIDPDVLESISLAGARFQWMIDKLKSL